MSMSNPLWTTLTFVGAGGTFDKVVGDAVSVTQLLSPPEFLARTLKSYDCWERLVNVTGDVSSEEANHVPELEALYWTS